MSIKAILNVSKREIKEIIDDKLYLCVVLILPLTMLLFFTIMFHDGAIDNLPIAICDSDHSTMSRRLKYALSATPGVDIAAEPASINDAERMMLEGKVYGIVVIEDGFESMIYQGIPTHVECYTSGANISTCGVVERATQEVVQTFSATISASKLISKGHSEDEVLVEVMPINFHTNIIGNPYLNYGYYLAPIFIFMGIVIFIVTSTIYAIGRELKYGTTVSWLQSANDSLLIAMTGKLLPIYIIMTLIALIACLIIFVIMGMINAGSYIILTLDIAILIIAYQSVAIFIISMTSNLRLGLSLGGGYAVMAFTFSGITFPTMAMFSLPRILSHIFPFTYFSDIFIDEVMYDTPTRFVIWRFIPLIAFTLLAPLSWHRLQRITTIKVYWGRD
jgi:ABC-2 type transport system permease protein